MIKKQNLANREFYLTGILILLLFLFSFLWYSQLTDTSSGLIAFTKKSFSNLGQIFNDDVRADQSFILDQFNIFYKPIEKTPLLLDYINKTEQKKENKIDKYLPKTYKQYQTKALSSNIVPFRLNYSSTKITSLIFEITKKLIKLFIIIGVFYLLFVKIKDNEFDLEFIAMSLIGISFLFFITIVPFASISYGLFRAYQQILVILSLSAVCGCIIFFKFLKENLRIMVAIIFFILYFLLMIGFVPQIIGGYDATANLNNYGYFYDLYYIHETEVISIHWFTQYKENINTYSSKNENSKLLTFGKIFQVSNNVFPSLINKKSYIYAGYIETIENKSFIKIKDGSVSYNFPNDFLNNNKNQIYNNGGSKIFR